MIAKISKKLSYFVATLIVATPYLASAQAEGRFSELDTFGGRILNFINNTLVPFLFAVILLLFIYGVYLYFVQGGADDDSRKTGRSYILYAVISLVVVLSVFGIANLIASGLGFNDPNAIDSEIPDGIQLRG